MRYFWPVFWFAAIIFGAVILVNAVLSKEDAQTTANVALGLSIVLGGYVFFKESLEDL